MDLEKYLDTKPNTTVNISIRTLEKSKNFISATPEVKSRNFLIEKSMNYVMDHWEDIKDDFLTEYVA